MGAPGIEEAASAFEITAEQLRSWLGLQSYLDLILSWSVKWSLPCGVEPRSPWHAKQTLNKTKQTFIYRYIYIYSFDVFWLHQCFVPVLAGCQHWLDCARQAGRNTDSCLCTPSNYLLDAPIVEIIWGARQVRNHADREYCKHVLRPNQISFTWKHCKIVGENAFGTPGYERLQDVTSVLNESLMFEDITQHTKLGPVLRIQNK